MAENSSEIGVPQLAEGGRSPQRRGIARTQQPPPRGGIRDRDTGNDVGHVEHDDGGDDEDGKRRNCHPGPLGDEKGAS